MLAQEMIVTPEQAQNWLNSSNTHNRKIYPSVVKKYAADMRNGRWGITNQGIGFDENNVLLDGQHRLMAVVESNIPVKMLVITGLPKMVNGSGMFTQEAIDTLKIRSAGDMLSLSRNLDNANLKVAIANMIVQCIRGRNIGISAILAWDIISLYGIEIDFILADRSYTRGLTYTPVITGMTFAAAVDLDNVIKFKDQYFSGIGLEDGSPILTFRNFMLNRPSHDIRGLDGGSYRRTILNYAMTALMYFTQNKPLKLLRNSNAGYEYYIKQQKERIDKIMEWTK